ncbi:UDP-N-acetylglucosamine-peptide N-acetylglucosaminyltransferase [Methylosinus sp. Sm6]|uniref:O-linked N-acetylglucosamine transferase, SPINDLY family protein n=1 Tax=Methylosinus sp. Sm6 TaxID=2866948 RepID=UPI001C9954A1|nr:UDP-N-acetylglucosamine-peptide N-acetylglucosaminyltransferase [Methylosinus sp. Sm6]MBY6243173.1 UDP-N-acetylglucosamine-peptide N-acetylglucosaminyltransferase [Methylosinus sp. Sm6]
MRSPGRSRSMCEWGEFAEDGKALERLLDADSSGALSPFLLLSQPGVDAKDQRRCSELWTRDRRAAAATERKALDFRFRAADGRKIKLGYLSNDFHDHATALLLIETLEAHDRGRFSVNAYSYGADDGKAMRRRLVDTFDSFTDVSALSDGDAARTIHRDEVDILIDLKGFTFNARSGIPMLRPAPVQVNYLGYPGTLGAELCDYIITDDYVTPRETAADYSESFAYMPHSYQPRGRAGPIGDRPTRAAMGLPEQGVVFCCFNQAYKFTPEIFDVWCRLLDAAPGSVLWLLAAPTAEGNLRNEAWKRGVNGNRLVFAPDMTQGDHLARLQLADLVLDTAPYNAHTTASDALWAGTPVVTCSGSTFPSRVAGSLLRAVGLTELIAADLDDYFALALRLAAEPASLAELRAKLARNRAGAALFDVATYTRDLEGLFQSMWSRRSAGLPPALIEAE